MELLQDPVDLTIAMVDVASVSDDEAALADLIEAGLRACPHLEVMRHGDALVARTFGPAQERVVIAGHIDTVPIAGNLPGWIGPSEAADAGPAVWGRGSVDMKGGLAIQAHLAAKLTAPTTEVTWVFYDHEEVEANKSGLGRLVRHHPDWLAGDFAVLCEPTSAGIEGGCNGTLRVRVTAHGKAAHSARPWLGKNAIHAAAPALDRLANYQAGSFMVDGLEYREALSAVAISGGIASNVIPDRCSVTVNHRFAPSKTPEQATQLITDFFEGFEVEVLDLMPGARPGLDHPAAVNLVSLVGGQPKAKYGWTDVARFSALGVPAVNFGPGDPSLAHADNEHCPVGQIRQVANALERWLTS